MLRTTTFLVLLATAALAGCADASSDAMDETSSDVARAEDVSLVGPDIRPIAMRSAFSSHPWGASEPTIGIDPEGRIFMTANGPALGNAPIIAMSDDQGETWQNIGPHIGPISEDTPRHPITTDPYVHVDPVTGRVYTADLVHNCSVMSWTDDQGATWLTNPNACGLPGNLDHQSYVTAEPRTVVTTLYSRVLYVCANEILFIDCAISLDGGITWGPQKIVDASVLPDALSICSALHGHLAAGPEGRVYLPTTTCPTGHGAPLVYRTDDDSLTWTKHIITMDETTWPRGDHETDVAVDSEGGVHVLWVSAPGRVYLASSNDYGDTWTQPLDVTAPGVHAAAYHQVIAGDAGKVAIAYVGTDSNYADPASGGAALEGGSEAWYPYLAVVLDAFADEPTIRTVQAMADPVAMGECGRIRCGGFVDFNSMAIDPDGRPWATMIDRCAPACDGPELAGVITLATGPSLYEGILEPLAWASPSS